MALLKITVKMTKHSAEMVIEPGMSVQLATMLPNPITNQQESEKINILFKNNYGVDLKKMGALNPAYLKIEKM